MKRHATHRGWAIDAAPLLLPRQRLFESCAVVESADGERFVFVDLGNRAIRSQAHERAISWSKRWIDNYEQLKQLGNSRRFKPVL